MCTDNLYSSGVLVGVGSAGFGVGVGAGGGGVGAGVGVGVGAGTTGFARAQPKVIGMRETIINAGRMTRYLVCT